MRRPDQVSVPAPAYGVDLVFDVPVGALPGEGDVRVDALPGGVAEAAARLLDRHTYGPVAGERGTHRLRVADGVASLALVPADRIARFCDVVGRLCATAPPPVAIAWYPSQQWVDPETFLDRRPGSPFGAQPLYGPVNVRYFPARRGRPPILDTIGLSALGWPDLQRFGSADPQADALALYRVADALVRGDLVVDGAELEVDGHRLRWAGAPCLHGPWRRVWDLRPTGLV